MKNILALQFELNRITIKYKLCLDIFFICHPECVVISSKVNTIRRKVDNLKLARLKSGRQAENQSLEKLLKKSWLVLVFDTRCTRCAKLFSRFHFIILIVVSGVLSANTNIESRQAIIKLVTPNIVTTLRPKFGKNGLITPDKVMLAQAIKQYQAGYNGLAMVYFKRSAAFGNTNAQTQMGLMYLKALGVERNWAIGYAWIRLAAMDKTQQHLKLKQQIYSLLTSEEIKQAEVEYNEIKIFFSRSQAYNRRIRWVRKVTGSALGSIVGAQTSNVRSVNLNGTIRSIYKDKRINAFKAFIEDFGFGIIESGEIIPVEKGQEEK